MYKKSGKDSPCFPSLIEYQSGGHFRGLLCLVPHSGKMTQRIFAKVSCAMNAFCILFVAGSAPVWAHSYGGGGFHGRGGFGGGFSRDSGVTYHQNGSYHAG